MEQVVQIAILSDLQGLWGDYFLSSCLTVDNHIGAYSELHEKVSELVIAASTHSVVYTAFVGRSFFNIPRDILKMYLNNGFTSIKSSQILVVNRKTVSRKIRQFDLTVPSHSDISDENLDAIV